jgi:hypothetical protein
MNSCYMLVMGVNYGRGEDSMNMLTYGRGEDIKLDLVILLRR